MDFATKPGTDAFREQVQAMVREHLTPQIRQRVSQTGTLHDWDFHRELARRGWIGAAWPVEEGGQGRDRFEIDILYEELAAAGAPVLGLSLSLIVAETIRRVGTDRQKQRIVGPVREGRLVTCLGYTEPDAGSDLAAVRTRATRDGAGWRINGQKNFTTLAHEAGYVFLLARTDPDAPKHAGMTLFLVPTESEGFSLTPVFTLSGERTNLTYYSDVYVDDEARVGELGQGWEIVTLALAFERGGEFAAQLRRLVQAITGTEHPSEFFDPTARARIGKLVADAEVARLLGAKASLSRTGDSAGYVEGAVAKVFATEALVRNAGAMLDVTGAAGMRNPTSPDAPAGGEVQQLFREAQISTIYGGTSEILRSVIAQRRLRLPRSRPR